MAPIWPPNRVLLRPMLGLRPAISKADGPKEARLPEVFSLSEI